MATAAEIKERLAAGGIAMVMSYTKPLLLTKKHVDYVRQDKDGRGIRLGWPGKSSVYCFADQIKLGWQK